VIVSTILFAIALGLMDFIFLLGIDLVF
jgi:hypothetical protein